MPGIFKKDHLEQLSSILLSFHQNEKFDMTDSQMQRFLNGVSLKEIHSYIEHKNHPSIEIDDELEKRIENALNKFEEILIPAIRNSVLANIHSKEYQERSQKVLGYYDGLTREQKSDFHSQESRKSEASKKRLTRLRQSLDDSNKKITFCDESLTKIERQIENFISQQMPNDFHAFNYYRQSIFGYQVEDVRKQSLCENTFYAFRYSNYQYDAVHISRISFDEDSLNTLRYQEEQEEQEDTSNTYNVSGFVIAQSDRTVILMGVAKDTENSDNAYVETINLRLKTKRDKYDNLISEDGTEYIFSHGIYSGVCSPKPKPNKRGSQIPFATRVLLVHSDGQNSFPTGTVEKGKLSENIKNTAFSEKILGFIKNDLCDSTGALRHYYDQFK